MSGCGVRENSGMRAIAGCVVSFSPLGRVCVGSDELIAFAVDVDDLYVGIIAQEFTEFGDIYIHASGVEIIVVNPDRL